MRYFFPALFALLVVAALPMRGQELSVQEIQPARKLYTAKCAKCHKLYDPAGYTTADWDVWMKKMAKKSKLKNEQFNLLTRYVATLRSVRAPEKKAAR
jgi:mono/diheme cytochrome c family protein